MKGKEKMEKIDKLVDSWIDSIKEEPKIKASPFFKNNVLHRIESIEMPVEGVAFIDKLFLRISLAAVFILIIMNYSVINKSLSSPSDAGYTVEEVVSAYSNVDADSYNNYSLLVYDSNK